MSEVRERFYAVVRFPHHITHESRAYDSYDEAYRYGVDEMTHNPRNIRERPLYFTVELRYEIN